MKIFQKGRSKKYESKIIRKINKYTDETGSPNARELGIEAGMSSIFIPVLWARTQKLKRYLFTNRKGKMPLEEQV